MLAIRFLNSKTVRPFHNDPYVTICLLDDETNKAQTKPGICRTVNAHWPSGNTVRIPVPRPDMTAIVEVWDREDQRDEDRLVGMGRINLADYDEDGAELEPLDIELFYERKHVGRISCEVTYDPPSMIPIKDGERINLSALSPWANIRQRLAGIVRYVRELPPGQKYGVIAGSVLALGVPFVRTLVTLGFLAALGTLWSLFIAIVLPLLFVMALPRLLGVGVTLAFRYFSKGYPLTIQSIMFVPWISNVKELNFRVIINDVLVGNPPYQGFTPTLLRLKRLEVAGAMPFKDLWKFATLSPQLSPLRDVPDFRRLGTVRLDLLEVDGVTVNLEVSNKNRLNITEVLSMIDFAAISPTFRTKNKLEGGKTAKFPNCLELRVLQARNLKSKDIGGYSDPFYQINIRSSSVRSDPVIKTLNPVFPSDVVERFNVTDPSTVVQIEMLDADVGRPSDFLGQWVTTSKWLLCNPERKRGLKYSTWETLSQQERDDGWIGFWAPLLNKHFREENQCGEIQVRMRWIYDPTMPERDPSKPISISPLEQLNMSRKEIRMRLGDLQWWAAMLKHIPILLDFHGDFILQNTKISVQDLLVGKTAKTLDDVIEAKKREALDKYEREMEEKQANAPTKTIEVAVQQPSTSPAAMQTNAVPGTIETPVAATTEVKVISEPPTTAYQPSKVVPVGGGSQRYVGRHGMAPAAALLREQNALPTRPEDRYITREQEVQPPMPKEQTTARTQPQPVEQRPSLADDDVTKPPRRERIKRRLHFPHIHLPQFLRRRSASSEAGSQVDIESESERNLGAQPSTTRTSEQQPVRSTKQDVEEQKTSEQKTSERLEKFHVEKTDEGAESTDNRRVLITSQGAELRQDDRTIITSRGMERVPAKNVLEKKEHIGGELETETPSGLPPASSRPGGHKPLVPADTLYGPASKMSDTVRDIEGDYEDDRTMEHLLTGEDNYSSGEEGEPRERTYSSGDEEDAKDMNRDEDTEYDEYGRKYARIKPIIWQKQFAARHGDPGITVFKLFERLVRGLIPHVATDARFNSTLIGATMKSAVKEPSKIGHGARHVKDIVKSKVKSTVHKIKDQGTLIENKLFHRHDGRGEEGATPDDVAVRNQQPGVDKYRPSENLAPATPSAVAVETAMGQQPTATTMTNPQTSTTIAPSAAALQTAQITGEEVRFLSDRSLPSIQQTEQTTTTASLEQQKPTPSATALQTAPSGATNLESGSTLNIGNQEQPQLQSTTSTSWREVPRQQEPAPAIATQQQQATETQDREQKARPQPTPSALAMYNTSQDESVELKHVTPGEKTFAEQVAQQPTPSAMAVLTGENVDLKDTTVVKDDSPRIFTEEFQKQPPHFQQFQMAQPELMMGAQKYMQQPTTTTTTTTVTAEQQQPTPQLQVEVDRSGRD